MPNIPALFETTVGVIRSLTDDKKLPIHIGEAMACWTYLAFVEEIIVYEQIGLNMTMDNSLHEMLVHALEVAQSHKKEISEFMQKEGIPLTDQPQSKSKVDPKTVPVGARFTDKELANALSINFVIASDMLAASASQSLRTDVGIMFLKFQTDKSILGFKMKNLMLQRGWLKIPPAYSPPGLPK